MMNRLPLITALTAVAALAGCLAEGEEDGRDPFEAVGETQSAVFSSWQDVTNPPSRQSQVRGIAMANSGNVYTWYSTGWACRGTAAAVCSAEE